MSKILLLGDSNTEWINCSTSWSISLSNILDDLIVINNAVSGMDSRQMLSNITNLMPNECDNKNDVKIVILMIGTNDCLRSISQSEYKYNLTEICKYISQNMPQTQLIIITPPLCLEKNIDNYVNVVRELYMENSLLTLMDLHNGNLKFNENDIRPDKIHLSASGNNKLLNGILELIKITLPEYGSERQKSIINNKLMRMLIGKK
jgi:lysophospholipase L1-like esterase